MVSLLLAHTTNHSSTSKNSSLKKEKKERVEIVSKSNIDKK